MKLIALLTDFGIKDNFVGVMKGIILGINPQANLVDITHEVPSRDIMTAAFLLKSSYKYFPKGSIFLAVVDPGVGSKRKPIIIHSKNYLFVGPDNGVLSLAAGEDSVKRIVEIENKNYFLKPISSTFHGRDIFAPVAAYLSKGKEPSLFGRPLNSIKKLEMPKPKITKDTLKGEVIHVDSFGNLITNIDGHLFQQFTKDKKYKIKIKNRQLNPIVKSYQAVGIGEALAIFGSLGFLEISINSGNAQRSLNAKEATAVIVVRRR